MGSTFGDAASIVCFDPYFSKHLTRTPAAHNLGFSQCKDNHFPEKLTESKFCSLEVSQPKPDAVLSAVPCKTPALPVVSMHGAGPGQQLPSWPGGSSCADRSLLAGRRHLDPGRPCFVSCVLKPPHIVE